MNSFFELAEALRELQRQMRELCGFGLVKSVDEKTRTVVLTDGEVDTQPLLVAQVGAGLNGGRDLPDIGTQAMYICPGAAGPGVAICGLALDQFPVPPTAPPFCRYFKDGSVLGYDPDSHLLTFVLPPGAKLEVTGDMSVTGTITANDCKVSVVPVSTPGMPVPPPVTVSLAKHIHVPLTTPPSEPPNGGTP